jgi:PhoH-like ATPase
MTRSKRIYVLDTNVLMHDPTAMFKFEEHDVFLPMQVIEELDNGKKGTSEAARNARQVSRFINELVEAQGADRIASGLVLSRPQGLQLRGPQSIGVLRFQTGDFDAGKRFGAVVPDNAILGAILALKEAEPDVPVVFVSKDINLRIKASPSPGSCRGLRERPRAGRLQPALHGPATELPADFWERYGKGLRPGPRRAGPITRSRARRGRTTTAGIPTSTCICPATRKPSSRSRASPRTRSRCRSSTTSAAASTLSGESTHATASRTSRSTR